MKNFRILDFTGYESGNCYTGGRYGFRVILEEVEGGKWRKRYTTTADFSFCQWCGKFDYHPDCEPRIYTAEEAEREALRLTQVLFPVSEQDFVTREGFFTIIIDGEAVYSVKAGEVGHKGYEHSLRAVLEVKRALRG